MKPDIHPEYKPTTIKCVCGHSWETRSTAGGVLNVDICSNCHPYYTGKQKLVDTAGRVERFRKRWEKSESQKAAAAAKAAESAKAAETASTSSTSSTSS